MTPTRLASAAASALLFVLLLSVPRIADLSWLASAGLVALVVLSASRPDVGLLLVAAALPVSTSFGRLWTGSGLMWPNALMVAFACGYFARAAIRPAAGSDQSLRVSTLTMAAVVVASVIVYLSVFLERLGGAIFREEVWRLATRDFLIVNNKLPGVTAAALLLEGLVVFYAAARLTETSVLFRRAAPRAVVTGAAVAASVNLWRLLEISFRGDTPLATAVRLISTIRLNEHYADMNAAGSYFVLALWVAVAIAITRGGRAWGGPAVIIAAGLWLTNSRTAVLAGLAAAALPLLLTRRRARRAVLVAAVAAGTLAVIGGTIALVMPERGNQQSPATALMVRTEMAKTAFRMFATRPIFGVGTGEFYQRSGEFSSTLLLLYFPQARNENAHNNFLQILAELGLTGFGAFLWILALAAWRSGFAIRASAFALRAAAGPSSPPRDSPRLDAALWGLATGIFAFLLTALAGHPLLIPEVAGTFWFALGILAGWNGRVSAAATGTSETKGRTGTRAERLLLPFAVIVLAITLPVRARQQIADTNLEHVGIGLSAWERTNDNLRYRVMSRPQGTVFVPGDAGSVTVPLRATVDGLSLTVELRLDGRLANIVRVGNTYWTNALVVLPRLSDGRRFRRLDLSVRGELPEGNAALLVGKVVPH